MIIIPCNINNTWVFIDARPAILNLFLANVPFLHPLKTPENQRISCFQGGIKWVHWPEILKVTIRRRTQTRNRKSNGHALKIWKTCNVWKKLKISLSTDSSDLYFINAGLCCKLIEDPHASHHCYFLIFNHFNFFWIKVLISVPLGIYLSTMEIMETQVKNGNARTMREIL